jgi:hypothetical protein
MEEQKSYMNMNIYPHTINQHKWEIYLERRLQNQEINILENVRQEKIFNDKLRMLHHNAKLKNYFVSKLTNLHGNCLFESLEYYKICDNKDDMRKGLAHLLYIFKDSTDIIPNDTRTFQEIFNDTNEVENVLCTNEEKAYKYNYDIMCQDLASGFSWTRLPTHLIMIFMSKIFNIRFEIISDTTDYVNIIDVNEEKDNTTTVLLGHIGETHYVPLDHINSENEHIELYHQESRDEFINWATQMQEFKTKKYMEQTKKSYAEMVNKEFTIPKTELKSDNNPSYVNY